MARIDSRKREVVDAASRSLDRLLDQFRALPEVDDDSLFEDGDDNSCESDPTESLSFVVHSSLHSIELQIQNLKRLSRTLQEATPDAKNEVTAVAGLVADTVKCFGSQEALSRYSMNEQISERKGLEEGRHAYWR
ncbi:hypothetical protein ACET3X_000582 [Alternaria dauci]|uniref:Uncharacterized protein n=1 Tax=Alternaria dauci TaxID=48095 RepID=A0ABR3UVY1_9PLEO